jgi:hypothetical protein
MSLPTAIHRYSDIAADLHEILNSNGRRMDFDTPAEAKLWRFRVYQYRKLLRKQENPTPFDRLAFKINHPPTSVHISEEYPKSGRLRAADGSPVEYVSAITMPIGNYDENLVQQTRQSAWATADNPLAPVPAPHNPQLLESAREAARGLGLVDPDSDSDDDPIPPPDISPLSWDDIKPKPKP